VAGGNRVKNGEPTEQSNTGCRRRKKPENEVARSNRILMVDGEENRRQRRSSCDSAGLVCWFDLLAAMTRWWVGPVNGGGDEGQNYKSRRWGSGVKKVKGLFQDESTECSKRVEICC
jgi:hypothetical protein